MAGIIDEAPQRADLLEAELEIGCVLVGDSRIAVAYLLRLSRTRVGLIINFNVPVLRKGILRRVL
jgi:hypothetical protein